MSSPSSDISVSSSNMSSTSSSNNTSANMSSPSSNNKTADNNTSNVDASTIPPTTKPLTIQEIARINFLSTAAYDTTIMYPSAKQMAVALSPSMTAQRYETTRKNDVDESNPKVPAEQRLLELWGQGMKDFARKLQNDEV